MSDLTPTQIAFRRIVSNPLCRDRLQQASRLGKDEFYNAVGLIIHTNLIGHIKGHVFIGSLRSNLWNSSRWKIEYNDDEESEVNPTSKENRPMKYETRTYIDDTNAAELSDDQILNKIRQAEEKLSILKKMKTKSSKLEKKVEKYKAYCSSLAAYLDMRDPEDG